MKYDFKYILRWRHNGRDRVSNQQPHDCLLNRLFRHRSKKTSTPLVTGLCAGNSPGTGEFPEQMASYTENLSIWWRHHDLMRCGGPLPPNLCSSLGLWLSGDTTYSIVISPVSAQDLKTINMNVSYTSVNQLHGTWSNKGRNCVD